MISQHQPNPEVEALKAKVEKLQLFKDFVHKKLDEFGVPFDIPESIHSQEGCRIGARLEFIFEKYIRNYGKMP